MAVMDWEWQDKADLGSPPSAQRLRSPVAEPHHISQQPWPTGPAPPPTDGCGGEPAAHRPPCMLPPRGSDFLRAASAQESGNVPAAANGRRRPSVMSRYSSSSLEYFQALAADANLIWPGLSPGLATAAEQPLPAAHLPVAAQQSLARQAAAGEAHAAVGRQPSHVCAAVPEDPWAWRSGLRLVAALEGSNRAGSGEFVLTAQALEAELTASCVPFRLLCFVWCSAAAVCHQFPASYSLPMRSGHPAVLEKHPQIHSHQAKWARTSCSDASSSYPCPPYPCRPSPRRLGRRLRTAVARLDLHLVAALVQTGADMASRDARGRTALHELAAAAVDEAAAAEAAPILNILLRQGAQVCGSPHNVRHDLDTRGILLFAGGS